MILLVITDGRRDCIKRTIPSALANLRAGWGSRIIYDDSANATHRRWLVETFGPLGFDVIWKPGAPRQGFGGAIRAAWRYIDEQVGNDDGDYIFHLEDDFLFSRPVDVYDLATVLEHRPMLTQLALRRQPWNEEERAAGGIVELHPDDYEEHRLVIGGRERVWLEHSRHFTTNPSLYRRSLTWRDWPEGADSEGRFGIALKTEGRTFGYWGSRTSGEWVEHIGHERVGVGY